jgi:flagellar biosynthesis protein FliP
VTLAGVVGIGFTLLFVLALAAVALRVLRRYVVTPTGAGTVRLQVVQRIGLGPRQGVAVVRIGERYVALSVGDGGVRSLLELPASEVTVESAASRPLPTPDFKRLLAAGMRRARGGLGALVLCALVAHPVVARAQTAAAAKRPAVPAARAAAVATPVAPTPDSTHATAPATAASTIDALAHAAPQIDLKLAGPKGDPNGLHLSGTVGVIVIMGLLTLLPTLLLLMTSFTRILVVLNFLRQAIGAQAAPPAHLVSALALLLTGLVMAPTLTEVNRTALTPWLDGKIDQGAMITTAIQPFREFMLRQTRQSDLQAFVEMSREAPPKTAADIPTVTLMSAFVTSELRTAFQIGFALFLPFVVIDIVVSAVLMSMGMMMLPPAMISLPFKLLLFVMVDGWSLVVQGLVHSFR